MINAELIILLEEYENKNSIDHIIAYFYRLSKPRKYQLPIYAYGTIQFPPTYQSLMEDYHIINQMQNLYISRTLWHFIISFDLPVNDENLYHHFADGIARLFMAAYPVCYTYHADTGHFHVHFCVLATGYRLGSPPLDKNRFRIYLSALQEYAHKNFQITLHTRWKNANT